MACLNLARRGDAGVTLIEILVVLVLVGTLTGVAMLSLPGGAPPQTAAREAALLAARIEQAAALSSETLRPARLVWDAAGYRFQQPKDGAWGPHDLPTLRARHELRAGLGIGGTADSIVLHPDLRPPAGGVLRLAILGATRPVTVRFDGLSAETEARP